MERLLRNRFDAYLKSVAQLNKMDPAAGLVIRQLPMVHNLARELTAAVGFWLDADPEKALQALNRGIDPLTTEIYELTSNRAGTGQSGPLFRVREEKLGARFSEQDMFHIPFEKRDRVATRRYSFPGLPCLYLGRSVYICWEESGRPDLHALWVSKFIVAPGETVRVLDFGHRPASVAAGLHYTQSGKPNGFSLANAAAYASLWPLIAGCSVRRQRERQSSFVVEYVLPQLLLWWLMSRMRLHATNHLDGIRYFSTQVDDDSIGIAGMNYVFPSQDRQQNGHCPILLKKFHLSPPVNWQIVMVHPRPPQANYNKVHFAMTPGHIEQYGSTDFGRVESFVEILPTGPA